MREADRVGLGRSGSNHYARALVEAKEAQTSLRGRQSVVRAEDQEWERCRQGLLKHLVHEAMGTTEFAVDLYQQVLSPGGRSGKHRHFSEEVLFVLEGSGHDLHWDPLFEVGDSGYEWSWEETPRTFEWKVGDFIYIPPYVTHQHCAAATSSARLLSATSRIVKMLGLNGLEQVEDADQDVEQDVLGTQTL